MNSVKLYFLDEEGITSTYDNLSPEFHVACIPYYVENVSLCAGLNFGMQNRDNKISLFSRLGWNRNIQLLENIANLNLLGKLDFKGALSLKVLLLKADPSISCMQEKLKNLKVAVGFDVAVVFDPNLTVLVWDMWTARWGFGGHMEIKLNGLREGKSSYVIWDKSKVNIRSYPVFDDTRRYCINKVDYVNLTENLVSEHAQ